jgi:hypothetical protein
MPLRSHRPALLACALVLAACAERHSAPAPPPSIVADPAPAPAPPPAPTTSAASAAPSATAAVAPFAPPTVGLDDAPGKRERVATAVVLFGTSVSLEAATLRFVPVVCSIQGQVTTGKPCGAVMPPRARVRLTRPGPGAPAFVTVTRSTRGYHDTEGGHVYPAPTGPECCMYNTCIGDTIPYLVVPAPRASPKAVLAVWPETADVDLRPRPRGVDRAEIADTPWPGTPGMLLSQGVRAGARRLVVGTKGGRLGTALLSADGGSGWAPVGPLSVGPDGYDILATADVAGDGRAEAIVYVQWRNDYGLDVLVDDWSKIAYGFDCGNI